MSEEYQRIELIAGTARRRHWSTEQKLRIIEESFEPGETVSSAARRNGRCDDSHRLAAHRRCDGSAEAGLRWRRLMSEGGVTAVGSDEAVVGNSEVRKLEERVRELERLLGRTTMENEILREALSKANSKKPIWRPLSLPKSGSR
jgi:transposase